LHPTWSCARRSLGSLFLFSQTDVFGDKRAPVRCAPKQQPFEWSVTTVSNQMKRHVCAMKSITSRRRAPSAVIVCQGSLIHASPDEGFVSDVSTPCHTEVPLLGCRRGCRQLSSEAPPASTTTGSPQRRKCDRAALATPSKSRYSFCSPVATQHSRGGCHKRLGHESGGHNWCPRGRRLSQGQRK